jgi:hypothetical protein
LRNAITMRVVMLTIIMLSVVQLVVILLNVLLSIITQNLVTQGVSLCFFVERCYAKCHFAVDSSAECHSDECCNT